MSDNSILVKRISILFFSILLLPFSSFGQADDQLLQVATEMYKFGDKRDALDVFKQAIELNPSNAKAHYMAGKAIIETINKEESLSYFKKAYELNDDVADDILYCIGSAYHYGYKINEAIEYFNKYLNYVPISNYSQSEKMAEVAKTERKIYECGVAKSILKRPVKVEIKNLGEIINSVDEDYAPVLSLDMNTMYFTSRRKGGTGADKDNDNEFFEDIYVSTKTDGVWGAPANLGTTVNTVLHESAIGLSADESQLYIYVDNDKHKGDIFVSKKSKAGTWSVPTPLDKTINSPSIENAITITADGKTMYFTSNRPGGKGGMDIYTSTLDKSNKWTAPINLGDTINTEYDDEAPFIAADGITLFFSSKGHEGMGGFDIFKSQKDTTNNKWSIPLNLQYPINSTDDDIYFSISSDGKQGFFSSVKPSGMGDVDIYAIVLDEALFKELASADSVTKKKLATITANPNKDADDDEVKEKVKQPVINPFKINIKVVSKVDKKPLDATIEIRTENGEGEKINDNVVNGNFDYQFLNTTEKRRYIVTIQKEGYLFKSTHIWINPNSKNGEGLTYTFELDPIQVGAKGVMRNIIFEIDKFTLSEKSNLELNKLLGLLKGNTSMNIEIVGHTDNTGNPAYNKTLSKQRAEAVKAWLIKRNIAASRLQTKGFGEEMPLASNDDEEEGRELNRRTEFVIIKK